jgi:hypothetical protein
MMSSTADAVTEMGTEMGMNRTERAGNHSAIAAEKMVQSRMRDRNGLAGTGMKTTVITEDGAILVTGLEAVIFLF